MVKMKIDNKTKKFLEERGLYETYKDFRKENIETISKGKKINAVV